MVTVTNALDGRTYISYEWKLKHAEIWRPRFPEDYTQVATSHIVPNGKWVMERPHGYAWIIGESLDEIEQLRYTDKYDVDRVLYISDKPFGWITAEEEDVDKTVYPPVPNGRRRLRYAQQIHKGELGQGVPVERLPYVRQAYEDHQKPSVRHAHERRRGYGWVRLADLVEATGLSYGDIVFGYWDYSGHKNYPIYDNGQEGGMLLDVVNAVTGLEIEGRTPRVHSMTQGAMFERLSSFSDCWPSIEEIWVRRGFAYTVLRLQALGVQPYAMQPA